MLLIALQDVTSTVSMIPKGAQFHELDDERAQQLIRTGVAKPFGEMAQDEPSKHDWSHATVVIIAGGESVTRDRIGLVKQWQSPEHKVIAVNTSYRKVPFADVLYACDDRWWNMPEAASNFEEARKTFRLEQMWTQDKPTAMKLGIQYVESSKDTGLSKRPGVITQGQSSGYQAIGLAVMWGAKKIVLLGFDAKGGHHHGDHPPGIAARSPFKAWIQNFRELGVDLKAAGIHVVNCSPGSAIDAFPFVRLEEVLCLPSAPSVPTRTIGAMPLSTDSSAPGMK